MPLDCEIWCFLTERRRLIERLWRLRTIQSIDEKRSKRRFIRLLHAFDTEDLAAILKAVESGGRDIKQCAPGPPMDVMEEETPGCSRDAAESPNNDEGFLDQRYENTGLIPQIDKPMSLPYLCCKLWRWKELQVDAALHRLDPLPWCRFGRVTMNNATVSCCNPYHYALWIIDNMSPTNLRKASLCKRRRQAIVANPETSPEDDSLSGGPNGGVSMIDHSFVTNDTGFGDEITGTSVANNILSPSRLPPLVSDSPVRNNQSHPSAWAHLYRWKEKERMDDRGVTLTGQFVAVGLLAHTVHDGQNVCIQWDIDNEASFALIRQLDVDETYEVWLYNSGDKPLFISIASSLSLHKSETIRRVSNGYCYRVHRGTNNALLQANTESHFAKHDPANTLSFLNISVGKGWGEKYHRINHTDTPCRYEVIFMPDNP